MNAVDLLVYTSGIGLGKEHVLVLDTLDRVGQEKSWAMYNRFLTVCGTS